MLLVSKTHIQKLNKKLSIMKPQPHTMDSRGQTGLLVFAGHFSQSPAGHSYWAVHEKAPKNSTNHFLTWLNRAWQQSGEAEYTLCGTFPETKTRRGGTDLRCTICVHSLQHPKEEDSGRKQEQRRHSNSGANHTNTHYI